MRQNKKLAENQYIEVTRNFNLLCFEKDIVYRISSACFHLSGLHVYFFFVMQSLVEKQ